jgi:hypothetical protein
MPTSRHAEVPPQSLCDADCESQNPVRQFARKRDNQADRLLTMLLSGVGCEAKKKNRLHRASRTRTHQQSRAASCGDAVVSDDGVASLESERQSILSRMNASFSVTPHSRRASPARRTAFPVSYRHRFGETIPSSRRWHSRLLRRM